MFLDGVDTVTDILHQLRSLGVRIALDDFRHGLFLAQLSSVLPLRQAKIDPSFVINIADDPNAGAIVKAILDLASALQMETTAEGVESLEQQAELQSGAAIRYRLPFQPTGRCKGGRRTDRTMLSASRCQAA